MPFFQPALLPLPSDLSFRGKTIIITGANAGIEFAARKLILLRDASEVIMAVRSVSKDETAKRQILEDHAVQNANPNAQITVMSLKLENPGSVVRFARAIKNKHDTQDTLLLNAGFSSLNWETVPSTGHEKIV